MARIFNMQRLRAHGALITLGSILKNHVGKAGFPELDMKDFGSRAVAIWLRWQVNPVIGLPSEPFKVWRRPATPLSQEQPAIPHSAIPIPPLGRVYQFNEPHAVVHVGLSSSGPAMSVTVVPLADGIGFENMLGAEVVSIPAGGSSTFSFEAPYITAVLVMGSPSSVVLQGLPVSALSKIGDWQLLETVGLPVDEAPWSDLPGQTHGIKQGMVGAETDAKTAAAQRFTRALNPYGWPPAFPSGELAPPWALPSAADMIADAETDVLPMLHQAMAKAPKDQVDFLHNLVIHPPENPNGQALPADDGNAEVSPIKLLQMAVATDPFQSVMFGFGTGYLFTNTELNLDLKPIHFGATSLFDTPGVSDWDFMVTGRWAQGLDGKSKEREYAAIIPRPRRVMAPPGPSDLKVHFLAHQRPAHRNGDWVSSARMSWERLPFDNLSPVASFAAARAEAGGTAKATPLMEPRPKAAGFMPIGNNENRKDPEYPRQSASDGDYPIPNDPGSVSARYGVATQNIFGIWSNWATQPFATSQPDPDPVNIVDAQLVPTDTGAGTVCPATLFLEIVVDWRVRSVGRIHLRGRLFAAATRHAAPPAGMVGGLQKSLGGSSAILSLTFAGDTPTLPGGTVICLDAQGARQVAPGQATQGHARRYRLTIPGFSLNYAGTPHIGLALQARLRERIAPHRLGDWGPGKKVAYASDPRARPTQVIDLVRLASLPDARGQCHAVVSWQPVPSATGYILYQSTETRLLASRGLPGPVPGTTLSDRLTVLKTAFAASPDRRDFTRANDALLTGESLDVALPRGTQDIHLFVVIPMSAGGVEGPWPSGPDADTALIPFAAPKIATPAPPRIEAARVEGPGGFAARLRIETRGSSGARPKRVDIYRTRVADAARQLDSMGLPVAKLTATAGGWTVTEDSADGTDWIDTVTGEDAAEGSWNYLWYRAVAWSEDDPLRGVRKGRGRASPAVPVLVPPAGLPPLTPLVPSWPGGDPGDVLFDFSAPVPLAPTPAGPHKMSVEVWRRGTVPAMFLTAEPVALAQVGETPLAGTTGFWRVPDGQNRNYRLLVHRADAADAVSVTVRLIDPIGRTSERSYQIEPGPILPLPSLTPIDKTDLTGVGRLYSVTTDAPLQNVGGAPYRVRVVLTPTTVISGGLTTTRRVSATANRSTAVKRATLVRPRPGPVVRTGSVLTGPKPIRPQFRQVGKHLVYSGAIRAVPVKRTAAFPSGSYVIVRQTAAGQTTLTVVARHKLRAIRVDILTPDGRRVTRSARG